MSVVHFAFRYPDGRIDTGCTATVRHRFRAANGGQVEVTVPAAYQCPSFRLSLERATEEYYRQRVGIDGVLVRIGPRGASPLILGVPRESAASVVFDAEATS
jgi:hypothetical protein